MPKPIPSYIPKTIKLALDRYPNGIKGLADNLGINYGSLINTFKRGQNKTFARFIDAANYLGIQPEELFEVLKYEPGESRKHALKKIIGISSPTTLKDVLKDEPAVEGFIYRLIRGDSGRTILDFYKPLADQVGLGLDQLSHALDR